MAAAAVSLTGGDSATAAAKAFTLPAGFRPIDPV
jgi:hypothetical protein